MSDNKSYIYREGYKEEESSLERLKNKLSTVFTVFHLLGGKRKPQNIEEIIKTGKDNCELIQELLVDLEMDLNNKEL